MIDLDWSGFEGEPESECACHCGCVYFSHARTARIGERWRGVSEKPCPTCGQQDNLRRISSHQEPFTLEGGG